MKDYGSKIVMTQHVVEQVYTMLLSVGGQKVICLSRRISYRSVSTLRLGCKNQSFNVVWGNNRSLF
jgi:hypothetical protein